MMPNSPLTPTQIRLRLAASLVALAAGVAAVIIAILLLKTALS
jgi:hypothetical protein